MTREAATKSQPRLRTTGFYWPLAVAVYTKEFTARAEADRERVIADIGLAIYDFFLLADK